MSPIDQTSRVAPPHSAVSGYVVPDLPSAEEVLPYLRRIDKARWYSNFGPLVCEFEDGLKAMLAAAHPNHEAGRLHLTTLVSGHQALEIALRLFGIGCGQNVLVPAVTFCACPLAVSHAGAAAVLADIDPLNWTLTPAIARAAAENMRIHAVMPVAIYGVPLPIYEWDEFSLDTGIPVVIDAAAAVETQMVPQRGLVAYSFHATKPFGIGEGGALVSRDADMIARGRQYSNFGTAGRIAQMDGSNAKMSEYHAAVGLAQIKRWENIKQRRRDLLETYIRCLEPLRGVVSLQTSIEMAVVSCLMLLLDRPQADRIVTESASRIAMHRTYLPPLYRHPYFSDLSVVNTRGLALPPTAEFAKKREHMLNSERLLGHLIGVPFHPFMKEVDVVAVVDELTLRIATLSDTPINLSKRGSNAAKGEPQLT